VRDKVRIFLEHLYQEGVEHDAKPMQSRRKRWNLEPDAAALVNVVLQAMGARRVLEIGTSNGYSTIWLADAIQPSGGSVLSADIDGDIQVEAARNLDAAGVANCVELRQADGGVVLREATDASLDAILLDSKRSHYLDWWPQMVRALRPGGLLAVDNVLSHASEVANFRSAVESDARFISTVVAVGKGELLAVKQFSPESVVSLPGRTTPS